MKYFVIYCENIINFFDDSANSPKILLIKSIMIASLFILSVRLSKIIMRTLSVRYRMQKIRFRNPKQSRDILLKKKHKSFLMSKLEGRLRNNGYPFGLTADKYIAYKLSVLIIAVASFVFIDIKLPAIILFGLVAFFFTDILIAVDFRDNKSRMEEDMTFIINNLYMQLEANVPIVECINLLHLSAVNSKLLKNGLKEFSIKFLLNDFDIESAGNELENKFDNITLRTMLMAFRQYKDSGKMKEILKRQYELNLKKEEEMLEVSSNSLLTLAAVSTILIGVNCVLMIVYPMFVDMAENMYNVLK